MRWWWLALLIGCYHPAAYDECNILCGADVARTCPSGQTCDDNGVCKPMDLAGNCPGGPPPDVFEFQDAPLDGPPNGLTCFGMGTEFFRVCVPPPQNDVTITGTQTFNTNDNVLCQYQVQASPPAVCVVAFRTLTVSLGSTLRVVGGRPLAIVVLSTLTIDGTIDVASHRGGEQGANANVSDCNSAAQGSQSAAMTGGGGGGAGGSLLGGGGGGGSGAGGSIGGAATASIDPAKLLRVRGGCPGGSGGKSQVGSAGGGGAGGGAIYLMSKTGIAMGDEGRINASGGAATSPGVRGGGGGGGSGGFIGFAAPAYMFMAAAKIYAIGGPGSSGGGDMLPGKSGVEATVPANTLSTPGVGGSGNGGYGAIANGETGGIANPGGGGGGGGGGGIIGFEGQMPQMGQFAPTPVGL